MQRDAAGRRYAKEHGKLITCDPNLRKPSWKSLDEAKEQMLWGFGQTDVIKISDEEVAVLFGLNPQDGAEHIPKEFGVKPVFVTCGPETVSCQSKRITSLP